ncbi:MAG: glycosyltransferase family 2 protein, partial [Thermodesulfobacteriota bacterium]|nr:glycosyltransferase family 2 protein [Thermodesulfobacteriota bacterium]
HWEVVYVDDGSSDGSIEVLEELAYNDKEHICLVELRRNFGQTQAMQAGIDHARGKVIITMDGDLQNDPADIPNLLAKMNEGYDVVSGWRKNRKDSVWRVIPSKVANKLLTFVTGVKIHDNGCSLKAYNTSILKKTRLYSEMHRFIPAFAYLRGARVGEIVVQHHPRTLGTSKYGFSRIWKVFFDLFTLRLILNFTNRPMEWFGMMGVFSIFIAIIIFMIQIASIKWHLILVWFGLLFTINGFILLGYGLICEMAVKHGDNKL